jgi:hypothetical protein
MMLSGLEVNGEFADPTRGFSSTYPLVEITIVSHFHMMRPVPTPEAPAGEAVPTMGIVIVKTERVVVRA